MAGKLTFNLADMFEAVADAVGERTAIVSCQRRLSYSELDERATRLANCWAGLGIGRGDRIGLQLYNHASAIGETTTCHGSRQGVLW